MPNDSVIVNDWPLFVPSPAGDEEARTEAGAAEAGPAGGAEGGAAETAGAELGVWMTFVE